MSEEQTAEALRDENAELRKHLRWALDYAHRGGAEYCCVDIGRKPVAIHPATKGAAHTANCPYRLACEALEAMPTPK